MGAVNLDSRRKHRLANPCHKNTAALLTSHKKARAFRTTYHAKIVEALERLVNDPQFGTTLVLLGRDHDWAIRPLILQFVLPVTTRPLIYAAAGMHVRSRAGP